MLECQASVALQIETKGEELIALHLLFNHDAFKSINVVDCKIQKLPNGKLQPYLGTPSIVSTIFQGWLEVAFVSQDHPLFKQRVFSIEPDGTADRSDV